MSTRSLQIECLLTPVIDYRDGSIASGYTVYFYSAGTSSAKNVYTEKEKTNPYTSRTLGSDGTVQVYGDGIYKIDILDTDGTTVYEWDNIKVQSPNIAVLSKSGTYTATVDDDYILVGATMTLNLYAAASFTHPLCVKLTGAYTLTIDPSGAELIEGASTYTLDTEDSAVWLFSNGSAWFVANATSVSAVDAINLVASVGGSAKLTAKAATIDIEDNNEYLRQKNAADDDYVDLVKVNDSDQIELGAVLKAIEILNTGLTIQDTGGDHTLTIKSNEDLNDDYILNLILNDSSRTIDLGGDFSITGAFVVSDATTLKAADILPSGTVAFFGQATSPTGWTKKIDWQDGAMLVLNSDADGTTLDSGGAVKPQTAHTHIASAHTHTVTPTTAGDQMTGGGGWTVATPNPVTSSSSGDVATASNTAFYYQEIICCIKD